MNANLSDLSQFSFGKKGFDELVGGVIPLVVSRLQSHAGFFAQRNGFVQIFQIGTDWFFTKNIDPKTRGLLDYSKVLVVRS